MRRTSFLALLFLVMLVVPMLGCQKEIADDESPVSKEQVAQLDHLIIQELCYLGSPMERLDARGKKVVYPYGYDEYIKIYNPTDKTHYLDGLLLVNSPFGSDRELSFEQNIFGEYIVVSTAVKFPGSGQEYPIEPGTYVLVAGMALDHTKEQGDPEESFVGNCPSSYDLRGAKFQWVSKEKMKDESVDKIPEVPCLLMVYSDSELTSDPMATQFQVTESLIALVRLGVDEKELANGSYEWKYRGYDNIGHVGAYGTALKLPIGWVIDAVNLCPTEQFKRAWFESLDKGCAGIRKKKNRKDNSHLGKAVKRKHDGRSYVDTNNSTVDFEVAEPSMATK